MFAAFITLEIIISFLLVVVILMQSSKGGGLAGTFGGGNVGMLFGVRRTADFLTRSTQILGASFLLLSLIINIFFLPRATSGKGSVIQQSAAGAAPAASAPAPQQQQPAQAPPVGGQ